jgi:hypothetical protein
MHDPATDCRETRRVESSRQAQETTSGTMRCSDFRGDDRRIDALGKHLPSDDPCIPVAGFGPQ